MKKIAIGSKYKNYKLLGFIKSKNAKKKYSAILLNTLNGKKKYVSFGSRDPLYEQYHDSTGLGLYSHLDHFDKNRRNSYRARHHATALKIFSPSYFSYFYLW